MTNKLNLFVGKPCARSAVCVCQNALIISLGTEPIVSTFFRGAHMRTHLATFGSEIVSPLGRLQWCPRHWALTRHAIVVSALRLSRISTADPTELKTEQLAQVPPHPNIRSNAACGVERAESPALGRGGQRVLVHYSHGS